jgi:hypothetical protein
VPATPNATPHTREVDGRGDPQPEEPKRRGWFRR